MNDIQTTGNAALTPDAFKALIVSKYPKAVSADGTPYAQMDATDLTKRIVQKYPDAVTKDGYKYSDYLPQQTAPQQTTAGSNQPGFLQSMAQGIAQPFLQGIRVPAGLLQLGIGKLAGSESDVQNAQKLLSNNPMDFGALGKVNQVGYDANGQKLGFGGATAQAVGAGLQIAPYFVGAGEASNVAENLGEQTVGGLIKTGAKTGAALGASSGAGQALQSGVENNKPLNETAASTIQGGLIGGATGGVLGGALGGVTGIVGKLAGKVNTQASVNDAIESVNPNMTAGKLAKAYEASAKNGSYSGAAVPSVDPRVVKIGNELSDIGLKPTDPRGNLVKLSRAMADTEFQIKPSEQYEVTPGVKTVLSNELDTLKNTIPREFKRIGDSQNVYNDVVDYAKEIVQGTKNTVGGYRNARTLFDLQSKLQFPTAFSDTGVVNLKTPAGVAIKAVRDTLNDNLYQIAPSNSNLQGLITREANIYSAIHNIAPKAAKLNGMSSYQVLLKNNPVLSRALSIGKWALPLGAAGFGGGLIGELIGGQK